MKRALFLFCAVLLAACTKPDPGPVTLRILSFNDFHGNIQSDDPSPGRLPMMVGGQQEMVEAGGAAYLATLVAQQKQDHPNNIVISAGDLTGASPLVSALLKDEPTIKVMNRIGLDLNVVGNHEFDHGWLELLQKKLGDICAGLCPEAHAGARFDYLAANVVEEKTGETVFPPYVVRDFDGVQVAFIGVVTAETPYIVAAKGIQGLAFKDPLETLNKYAGELRNDGVEAIVAVLHEGASVPPDIAKEGSACQGMEGVLTGIVAKADPAIDLFITGHTHQAYACRLDGRLVTQTASYGRMLSVIDLALARDTGDVTAATARNLPVTRDLAPDPAILAEIAAAEAETAPIRAKSVGTLAAALSRQPDMNGESALGVVIADAQLQAGRQMGAKIAFMNPGGIRQDLPSDPAAGLSVTLGDLFAVQPFGNNLVVMDLTGAEIKTLLEQQWLDQPADRKPRILQVSEGFTYCYDDRRPEGDKILGDTIRLNGAPLQAGASYRVVVNSFLADGGDRFTVLKQGRARVQGGGDLDALQEFVRLRQATLPGQPQERICRKG